MPRPRKCRTVAAMPNMTIFKPRGLPMQNLTEVYLPLEGLESLRLADLEKLKHEDAAEKMNISRQTFGRILSQARATVADAIMNNHALRIQGGDYTVASDNPPVKENNMDKIAVSAESPVLDDVLDPRFGRAAGFIIISPTTMESEYIDNGASQAMAQGAGIQAAEIVARSGAKTLLTGYVGPKAFRALQAAGITIVQNLEDLTVRQAVERFQNGDVKPAEGPNTRGHGR